MLQTLLRYNFKRSPHTSGRATRIAGNPLSVGYTASRELRVQEDHDATDKDREYKARGERQSVRGKRETVRKARGLDVPLETCYFFLVFSERGH